MSRIIKDRKCTKCKHVDARVLSFGHPDKDVRHEWNCEKCGAKNVTLVEEWISSSGEQDGVVVWRDNGVDKVKIFTSDMHLIDETLFEWKEMEDEMAMLGDYLQLSDIITQIAVNQITKDSLGVFFVWIESPLYGAIYMFGNHDEHWYLHAKTNGYA